MASLLILATSDGVAICRREAGSWRASRRSLSGVQATSVIAREGVILAGTTAGILRSDDLGETWREANQGLLHQHIRWLAYHPDISDFELAGTEPAAIFVSRDGAATWRECPEVAELRARYGWYLPYSPEAGCVRGFAISGSSAYAAVEDGCVLASKDGGETWELSAGSRGHPEHNPPDGMIHSDVHSIEIHPALPGRVYAPTGGGFYVSADAGGTWTCLYPQSYCRAVWVDPADPEHILLGPADGVDRGGRIEASRDGGRSWQPAAAGLEAPWPRTMVERFYQAGGELLAVLSNGELLAAPLDSLRWQAVLPEAAGVRAVTTLEID